MAALKDNVQKKRRCKKLKNKLKKKQGNKKEGGHK
jgi:hypothetical protein